MIKEKICLASDNYTAAHPLIIEAISDANAGCSPAYGSDPWTEQAEELLQLVFKTKPKVHLVPSGTGSNVLALRLCCKRHESVICSDIAHIHCAETGAAESIIGCKLLTVPHQDGKIYPERILRKLNSERASGKHAPHPRVLSITQPTEIGSVYTLAELKALSKFCQAEHLLLHMDGNRLYNAAVQLQVPLSEMTQASGLDVLSLGGTKNGLISGESVLIFNQALQEGSDHLHKQTLQLTSKMRYLSAQYLAFFKNELWRQLATHANQKAHEIAAVVKAIPQLSLSYPVETNQIFFTAPAAWVPLIQAKIFCYLWDQEKNEIRFIASWNTSDADVESVRSVLTEVSQHPL